MSEEDVIKLLFEKLIIQAKLDENNVLSIKLGIFRGTEVSCITQTRINLNK